MKQIMVFIAALCLASCSTRSDKVSESQESESNQPIQTDSLVYEKIAEFYTDYVFGAKEVTDKVIRRYCTEKLVKKLKDAYDYDGEGYAIWEFRSDAQDGNEKSTVDSYEALGDGKYKVYYNDMGTRGSCIITVVTDGNNILFDEIEKVMK